MGRRERRIWWDANWQPGVFVCAAGALGVITIGALVAGKEVAGIFAMVLAVACLVAAVFGPRLRNMESSADGLKFSLDPEDREAAAAANAATQPETVEEIASDDPGPPSRSDEDPDVIGVLNFTVGDLAMGAIVRWARAIPELADADFRLFLYDGSRLVPAVEPPDNSESAGWLLGQGATGVAWSTGGYVLVEGDAVSDGTYGLTAEQQQRYRRLQVVAAAPIFDDLGEPIGVLTASSEDAASLLGTPAAEERHLGASLLMSRVLIELFKWVRRRVDEDVSDVAEGG